MVYPFSVRKRIIGDTITLDFVLTPEAAALDGGAGQGAYEVQIALDPLALGYVEGSFAAAPGITGLPNELNSASGILSIESFAFEFVDGKVPKARISETDQYDMQRVKI